ncbi:MAG: hypothetical protein CMC76_00910, partial [Flavobacteriaceae bacterium]|nr:hypothetical protein [Flavobacteriaceae bacterium]
MFFVCFLGVVVAFNRDEGSKLTNSFLNFTSENTEILPPSASISGTATVCLNENPLPQVTFTGSGGNTPYTFTYTINAGAPQIAETTGTNESISVDVMTNAVGVFIYELISVTDGSNDTSSEN